MATQNSINNASYDLTLTTDLSVANGGTGASTFTDHGVLIGNAANAITATAEGTTGVILTGSTGNAPVWTTATYPATVAIGDVLVASAANVIGVEPGAATAGYVLTANGAGAAPTFQANAGGGIGTLAGDSGTATGPTVTVAGGTNITTAAGTATLTINLDTAISGSTSHVFADGGVIGTSVLDGDTLELQAYDVNGTTYVTFATLTAADTPTMDLASAVTIGGQYIYRATGTDIPVTDGGTGASTLTDHGVLIGNATNAITATAEGATGTVLIGTTSNPPSFSASPTLTTVTATTFDTGVSAAAVTLAGTTLAADGTDGNINITITPKGTGRISTAASINAAGISFDAGTTTLSVYKAVDSATWTPTISFAGGTTGITYGTQIGIYSQIGNIWFFRAVIILTSKGSSTGQLRLNLPITPAVNGNCFALLANVTFTGETTGCSISSGNTYLTFNYSGNSSEAHNTFSDAECENDTNIRVSGFIWV